MLEAVLTAPTGDDVMGEDPTANALEAQVKALAKADGGVVLMPTATMSNQTALRILGVHQLGRVAHPTLVRVVTGQAQHVAADEMAGLVSATVCSLFPVVPKEGFHLDWERDVKPVLVRAPLPCIRACLLTWYSLFLSLSLASLSISEETCTRRIRPSCRSRTH